VQGVGAEDEDRVGLVDVADPGGDVRLGEAAEDVGLRSS
jgi:hypothetical protein